MSLSELSWSSEISAARRALLPARVHIRPAHMAVEHAVFISEVERIGCLTAAVFLEVLQNCPRLFGWEIGPYAHVEQDRFQLRRGSLGGVTLRVATIAMHGIEFGAG